MKKIEVVAAVIFFKHKILCVQRKENKLKYISRKYEFPGGKVEIGESKEEAVKREIKEELLMDISVDHEFLTVEHEYPDFHITMHSFLCSVQNANLTLTEHINYIWLETKKLKELDWAEADMPIVRRLASQ